jgi:hypothetical protein
MGEGGMLTRRVFHLSAIGAITFPASAFCQSDDTVTVRIRADESAGASIPPILRRNLTINPDGSKEAQDLVRRAPAGRAVPVMLIIVGAMTIPVVLQMIKELVRQT